MTITAAAADPEVAGWVRRVAAGQDARVGPTTPVVRLLTYPLPTRPFLPAPTDVFLCAGVAIKVHPTGTGADDLGRRLAALHRPDLEPLWIQPLGYRPLTLPGGRLATVWPRVQVLSTLDKPPWQDAATLLARLHSCAVPADAPPARHPAAGPATAWVHGGFHLGHLAHTVLRRRWKLVDVDRLGVGDPAWDLARPAACHAAGLLDDDDWRQFVAAYRDAGGPAVPASGDPWPSLEAVARQAALSWATTLADRPDAAGTARALLEVAHGGRH